jgi:hypothetical protein
MHKKEHYPGETEIVQKLEDDGMISAQVKGGAQVPHVLSHH